MPGQPFAPRHAQQCSRSLRCPCPSTIPVNPAVALVLVERRDASTLHPHQPALAAVSTEKDPEAHTPRNIHHHRWLPHPVHIHQKRPVYPIHLKRHCVALSPPFAPTLHNTIHQHTPVTPKCNRPFVKPKRPAATRLQRLFCQAAMICPRTPLIKKDCLKRLLLFLSCQFSLQPSLLSLA